MKTTRSKTHKAWMILIALIVPLLVQGNSSATVYENQNEREDSSKVYTIVEQMPQIIGGISELYSAIVYPNEALDQRIEGKVFIQFIVNTEGEVTEPKILKDIGFGCGKAAIQALNNIKFTPGVHEGEKVHVAYTLPVTFRMGN